jgi:hypothetical protein
LGNKRIFVDFSATTFTDFPWIFSLGSVDLVNEDVDNSLEILSEFLSWRLDCNLHVNHELEAVAAEAVASGNAHFGASATVDEVQKGITFRLLDAADAELAFRLRLVEVC